MIFNLLSGNANNNATNDSQAVLDAVSKSQAIIEFSLDGTILTANDNFLAAMGYTLSEIKGKHHRIFVDEEYARSDKYKAFWESLASGESDTSQYKRFGKGNKEIWIQASYNPVRDDNGKLIKVVKLASDITDDKRKTADYESQLSAISRSQAVIEFDLKGNILKANENFLNAMGYSENEVVGKHHSMFAEPQYAASAEYRQFWADLASGKFASGEFKRFAKGNREIWIQATYNPIFDMNGQPVKVVKYATDITDAKLKTADYGSQLDAISKSQAVIEFDLNGNILKANDNFLNALGYSLNEIVGRHHSMFVKSDYANSPEYKDFWSRLGSGEFEGGEYLRVTKGGKDLWIQATYNPILDPEGKPYKVVKFATDITERKTVFSNLAEVLESWSQGDLSANLHVKTNSEFCQIANDVNSFATTLSNIFASMGDTAKTVLNSSQSMAQSNLNLSRRTEQQAANLEQAAVSMDEITSTVKQTADNAAQANELAHETQVEAVKGGEVVNEAVAAMEQINQSSSKISEIISVIDEIAFQTNLLALNASVEAARAGEQGRGFAVVASEVRNLAGRSATAAKEIKELIEDSVKKVAHGSTLVGRSGDTLQEIVERVKHVTETVSHIAGAAEEQSTGISEVHQAVEQLQLLTQQNTAMVEEAAAASEELSKQADTMDQQLTNFSSSTNNNVAQFDSHARIA